MFAAYFPFTYIKDKTVNKIYNFFGKFILYQPVKISIDSFLSNFEDKNMIDIITPVSGYKDEIKKTLNCLTEWFNVKFGKEKVDIDLLKFFSKKTHLYEEDSLYSVYNKIGKIKDSNSILTNIKDPLFEKLLFLSLAHQMDLQNDQVYLTCQKVIKNEKKLDKIFKGNQIEKTNFIEVKTTILNSIDSGEFMCLERIKSWIYLALKAKKMPSFLLTDSYFVMDILLNIPEFYECFLVNSYEVDSFIDTKQLYDKINFFLFKRNLNKLKNNNLKKCYLTSKKKLNNRGKIDIMLYVLPDVSLKSFFFKMFPETLKFSSLDHNFNDSFNTVIVYFK